METIDYRTKEQKREDLKMVVKQKWDNFAGFIRDNKDVLILTVPAGLAVIGGVTKVASKAINAHTVNKEIDFKTRTVYDRSLGRYIELKRPLTTSQALEVEARKAAGEGLTSILDDMNMLK